MLDPEKKTIIFDFGNILLNLDFKKCLDTFHKVLGERWEIDGLPKDIKSAMFKYERGKISDEAFLWALQQYNTKAEVRDIVKAWNSILVDMPQNRFTMLSKLRKTYNICLLSNINNLHLQWIHRYFKRTYDLMDYEGRYFDKVFYSHLINMRKPDDEIYEHVLDVLQIPPRDILFIDDLKQNIEAAHRHGWNGVVHNPKKEITDLIQAYLDKVGFS